MTRIPGISGTIGLDERPAVKAVDATVARVKTAKQEIEGTMGQAGEQSARSFLKGVSSEFGKKSVSAQFLKAAMGGGAIAGVNMFAREIEAATGKMAELATARRNGDIAQSEFTAQMVREIPIFGTLVSAVDNVREAITGEGAALDKQVKKWKDHNDQIKAGLEFRKQVMKEGVKAAEDWAVAVGKLDERLRILRTPEGAPRDIVRSDISVEDMLAEARKRYEKDARLTTEGTDFTATKVGSERYSTDLGELPRIRQEVKSLKSQVDSAAGNLKTSQQNYNDMAAENLKPRWKSAAPFSSEQMRDAESRSTRLGVIYQDLKTQLDAAEGKLPALENQAKNAEIRFATERTKILEVAGREQVDSQKKYWDEEFKRRESLHSESLKLLEDEQRVRDKAYEDEKRLLVERADAGKKLTESLATPVEKMNKEIADAKELLRTGDISQETFNRVGKKARDDASGVSYRLGGAQNVGIQASELRGTHRVTVADVPQPYMAMARDTKAAADTLKLIEGYQRRAAEALERSRTTSGSTETPMELPYAG